MAEFDPATRLDKSYVEKIRGASDAARKRRKAIARESEKQVVRNAFLSGVRAERMRNKPWCENCGVEGWEATLELHHLVKRSQGNRYDGEEYGIDRPQNLQLLCRRCHQLRESNPEWGRPDDTRR